MAGETKVERIGRFDYVEPMNLDLNLPDNAITHKPEDYCISVNLTVEVPSRFYKENNDVVLVASSDNGSISFFGGSQFNSGSDENGNSRGYLSTSWTDISVNNVGKGNKECLGIESINIAYSPNFFPMVTIRFVDVRGASLFLPQEEAYTEYVKDNGYNAKRPFDGNSFFKSLFSMPSPIFKLTVKGFYGKPVTYKLLMSKFDSEFDAENGNFIANVQFAGYMYGVYTELPMSMIALAPYLDGLNYWGVKKFKFKNGIEIPTIPDLIKRIGLAAKDAPKQALESEVGRNFTNNEKLLALLNKLKNEFPFKEWKNIDGEKSNKSKQGIYFADKNIGFVNKQELGKDSQGRDDYAGTTLGKVLSENREFFYNKEFDGLNECITETQTKPVYYLVKAMSKSFVSEKNADIVELTNNEPLFDTFVLIDENKVNSYKELLKELVEDYGSGYQKYLDDFNEILRHGKYDKTIYKNGSETHGIFPVMCMLTKDDVKEQVRGVDFYCENKKTYFCTYLGFKYKDKDCKPEDIRNIVKKYYNVENFSDMTVLVYSVRTNIIEDLNDEIKRLEGKHKEEEKDLYEEKSILEEKLLEFPLTIGNIYDMVFAHIDTFMHVYYNHLKNISIDNNRKKLINDKFDSLLDVSDKCRDKDIPPFPTFIEKKEKNSETIAWPENILNGQIEETKFVEEILNAALQLGNEFIDAQKTIDEYGKNNSKRATDSLKIGTNHRIPVTIFDFLNDGDNPYAAIYEDYKKNPNDDIKQKIWFTFIVRCAYFGLMFRRYRMTATSVNDKPNQVDKALEFIGMAEAVNIAKVFGENMSDTLVLSLTKDEALGEFINFLGDYIEAKETEKNYGTVGLSRLDQNDVWNGITLNYFKIDDVGSYTALPVKNIDVSRIGDDIRGNIENNDNYVIFKKNGYITNETLNDKILNKDSIVLLKTSSNFNNYSKQILADSNVGLTGWQDSDFLDDYLNHYIGSDLSTCCNPYSIGHNGKIFIFDEKSSGETKDKKGEPLSFTELVENGKLESNTYFLKEKSKDGSLIRYGSIVNGEPCIDPINVFCSGFTDNHHLHFPTLNKSISFTKVLNEHANVYDKAYLFLFTIPLTNDYMKLVTCSNMEKVCNVALLREGAFYYWQENYGKENDIRNHFYQNYGKNMGRDDMPIVDIPKTKGIVAPTLYLLNSNVEKYIKWPSDSEVPLNRRYRLIDYFMSWAESQEFDKIQSLKGVATGLTVDEATCIMSLYFQEVLYIDYAEPLYRMYYSTEGGTTALFNKQYFGNGKEKDKDFFKGSYEALVKFLKTLYSANEMLTSISAFDILNKKKGDITSNDDFKLSIYLTLQSIYNKFIAGSNLNERWVYGGDKSEFKHFHYLDSFYNKIGQKLVLNGTRIKEMLENVSDTVVALSNANESMYRGSVYEFFSKLCQENGLNLMALPVEPYTIEKNEEGKLVWNLFDTISYSNMNADDTSCFVSMYTYRPSEHLDTKDDSGLQVFKNDGFNISKQEENYLPEQLKDNKTDINNNGANDFARNLQDFSKDDAPRIPAFGVSYAKQNQSIFKKITVSTANPQITEPGIAMTLNIAAKGDSNPRDSVFFGQDIYSVYSNYSYTCDVEMMGCAPIMPLMYFQLNNIPMFKGAYMIINVEHNVVAGNMTTKFKGVRVNKAAIPFVKTGYVYNDDLGNRLYQDDVGYSESEMINRINRVTPQENYDDSSLKSKIEKAFDLTFSSDCVRVKSNGETFTGETKGLCAKFTYNMAYSFIKGVDPCGLNAGGNANQSSFHENLIKLGYCKTQKDNKPDELHFWTPAECTKYISENKFYYGDVVVYWANRGDGTPRQYGHAQIYIGDAKPGKCKHNWASSMMDNYQTPFVYGSKSNRDWTMLVFRQPLRDNENIA